MATRKKKAEPETYSGPEQAVLEARIRTLPTWARAQYLAGYQAGIKPGSKVTVRLEIDGKPFAGASAEAEAHPDD